MSIVTAPSTNLTKDEHMMPSRRPFAFSNGSQHTPSVWPRLTTRESVVLKAIATGDSNKEIATSLGIGEQTVKNHVSVLIQKFHVRNRVQLAVLVALEMPELFHRVT
jgi:DNA-binding NarL/FixJ family response regulator